MTRRILLAVAGLATCFSSSKLWAESESATTLPRWLIHGEVDARIAQAEFRNPQGEEVGLALLAEAPYGVEITVEVSKLPPGRHGFHVHEVGRCDPPDFSSAGRHFNPRGKRHGLMVSSGPHVGDMPNLIAGPDGTARAEIYLTHATLAQGTNSLLPPSGTALIIHADADDGVTDPSGNTGARIACGIIRGGRE